ncbi:TetR/AcrR family transcriptional regulator [Rhodococcoides fascians]|uniref:TetR/AcrR family transcriptional regulator n=1 Tax=Rhodococcoides fascians TaxID=1828 RepID=UPI0006908561|nr:TetR/AcrR family transcriptional regulator [Rhodococcus fascians]
MFAAKGYGSTTTREIAAGLGLSAGAVYPHYKTKESLLFAISLEGHRAALAATVGADCESNSPEARLSATLAAYVTWHAENHALARVVQHELRSLSAEHFVIIADIRRSTFSIFARIIEAGAKSVELRPLDIEAVTFAITSLGVDVSRWLPSNTYADPQVLAARYVKLALRMVGCGT